VAGPFKVKAKAFIISYSGTEIRKKRNRLAVLIISITVVATVLVAVGKYSSNAKN
jgi:hypothetical protein